MRFGRFFYVCIRLILIQAVFVCRQWIHIKLKVVNMWYPFGAYKLREAKFCKCGK